MNFASTWGRLTGRPGVLFSNPGPGIANLVTGNNQAFGWVQYNQVLNKKPLIGTGFEVAPDFTAIAEAQGCRGFRLTDPGCVDATVAQAHELNRSGVPVLIDAQIARHDYYDGFVEIHEAALAHPQVDPD
ncbi:MAG: hypothetical protein HYU51_12965 [Candidatus Rokubacteria bacterium]|nr:hypothetical protein [Candidatus Rokubacteria bacterium]